jgi:hypothetical protein
VRPIRQSLQPRGLVAGDPVVDALASDSQSVGDLSDLPAVLYNGHDCALVLFHDAELHEHRPSPALTTVESGDGEASTIRRTVKHPGATVKDQPGPSWEGRLEAAAVAVKGLGHQCADASALSLDCCA